MSLVADQIRTRGLRPAAVRKPLMSVGWSTRGADILTPAGNPFVLAGVSWYGLETPQSALYGLDVQNYTDILNQAKSYQFNTLRIPFSNEGWETNPLPNPQLTSACTACQGMHARDLLALVINYAGSIGLHVILDDHPSDAGSSPPLNGFSYNTHRAPPYTHP